LRFASILILIPYFINAQQPERCATVLYNKLAEQKNPALAEKRNAFNRTVEKLMRENKYEGNRSVITIPVVVHVVYRTNLENISDAQIQSQIDVLNEDYGRMNPDTTLTPAPWKPMAANTGIQFCLASRKPNGEWTNGIERKQSLVDTTWQPDNSVKFSSSHGLDSWGSHDYLNIWVCNLVTPFLGFSTFPGGDSLEDGVVIVSRAFGRINFVSPPFDRGRTTTHEVGHWLNLMHVWGEDGGSCLGTDVITDTPNQADFTQGCPSFPVYDNCSPTYPGIMFMNYMDYTYDACMNMYTLEQSARMNLVLNTQRVSILTSSGCLAPNSVDEIDVNRRVTVYPNPDQHEIHFRCTECIGEKIYVSIFDMTGKEIFGMNISSASLSNSIDVSSLDNGIYFLQLRGKNISAASRFILIR